MQELPYVQLLYDVLEISSAQVNKAILSATENLLVCETAEQARRIAYESKRYDVILILE